MLTSKISSEIQEQQVQKELSEETINCITEIMLNYYYFIKENACIKNGSALPFQPIEKEGN